MIARMIEEDMLEPLNFDNIPNFADIDPNLKNPPTTRRTCTRALHVGPSGRHLQQDHGG